MKGSIRVLAGRRIGLLTAMLAVALFTASAPTSAQALRSIKIGLPPFYSNGLYHVATERGFWKEEGLEVSLVEFNGAPQVNEALLAGSIQFGHGGVGPAIALVARGGRVLSITSEAYTDTTAPPELIVVAKDSPYTDVKQLAGKKVGVHAKGTLSHILLEQVKRRLGIQMTVLEIPAPSQYVGLSRGDIDAVINETPFPEQMKAQGAKYLYGMPNKDVVPALAITQTLVSREYAEKHRDVVVKVTKVVMRAARWAMDHPTETRTIISKRRGYDQKVIDLIHPRSFKWSRNGTHMMPSIKWWGASMHELGVIREQPKYEDFFVSTYSEAALKELGRVKDADFDEAVVALGRTN